MEPASPHETTPTGFHELGTLEQLAALYMALSKAQAAFLPVHRTRTVRVALKSGGQYSFAYAPLEDLIEATRPALAANGLAVLTPAVRDTTPKVVVILAHEKGGRVMTEFAFKPLDDMKDLAGQITYLRRYGYSSMLNLAADDDADDVPEPTAARTSKPRQAVPMEPAAMHQLAEETRAADAARTEERRERLADAVPPPDRGVPTDAQTADPIVTAHDPAWSRWLSLVERAEAVKVSYEPVEPGVRISYLREQYSKLTRAVAVAHEAAVTA